MIGEPDRGPSNEPIRTWIALRAVPTEITDVYELQAAVSAEATTVDVGLVEFMVDGRTLGLSAVERDGGARIRLTSTAGAHRVRARYTGTSKFQASAATINMKW